MTIYLKQNTASQEVPVGPFLDDTDGKTPETGLTIANTDIKLWKNGATTLANKNSGGATHISGGIYYAVLDATDTNTLGPMVIFISVSGALPVRLECCVLAANVFDSLVGGSDLLQVDTQQFGNAAGTFASGIPAVNTTLIEGSDATNQIRDSVVDDATRIDASALNTLSSHDPGGAIASASALTTVAGYIDTEVAAIKAKTDNLPSDPADASDIAAAFGTVNSNLATIAGYLDTEVSAIKAKTDNLPSDPASASVVAGRFDTLDTAVSDLPTNAELATALGTADDAVLAAIGALEAHGDANWSGSGSAPSASEIADEVATRTLNANIVKVNSVNVDGTGTEGDPWGPA